MSNFLNNLFTGPGSGWTYVVIGLILIGIIYWVYHSTSKKDKKPTWLKSTKSIKKPPDGPRIVTKQDDNYDNFLELAIPEKDKLEIQGDYYDYTGKPLAECPKIVWEFGIPYNRYPYKVGSLIIREGSNGELKLYKPARSSQNRESIITTGTLLVGTGTF
jgi:hypothetical protein